MRLKEFVDFAQSTSQIMVPRGTRGPAVADLQKALLALGYKLPKHGVDGFRGPETNDAIKQFEKDNALTQDGSPDKAMIDLINKKLKDQNISFPKSTEADVKPGQGGYQIKQGSNSRIDKDTRARAQASVAHLDDPNFDSKLKRVSDSLGIEKRHLIAVMKAESNMDPTAVNKDTKATGLIQFMPKTARSLGTSVEELRTMSATDQLDYVYRYYRMIGVKPGMGAGDLYMATFMPAAVGKPDDFVLGVKNGKKSLFGLNQGLIYAQNSTLDKDRDGLITVGDVKSRVERYA